MYEFKRLTNAAGFALRCLKPAFVFDGPEENFVVAIGRDARRLIADGHEPYGLAELSRIPAKSIGD